MTPQPASGNNANKQKLLVVGGGCAALASVFALTDTPEDREKFEITVYQPGWRLGGKGASGRNAQYGQRIEEHGLHLWSGFYENAFWMMRKCYSELKRPKNAPLASVFQAFIPKHFVGMPFLKGKTWNLWSGYIPHEAGLPGDAIAPDAYRVVEPVRRPWVQFKHFIPWSVRHIQSNAPSANGTEPVQLGEGSWLIPLLLKTFTATILLQILGVK